MTKMTTRRKLAIATWKAPQEGNIFGKLTVDVSETLKYIEYKRKETGEKITITHVIGKALGNALKAAPSLNGRIVLGKFIPFETVDISFLVAVEDGKDLAKVKVERVDEKSVLDIAKELNAAATRLKRGEDEEFEKSKGPLRLLPTWLIRPLVNQVGFLTSGLGLNLPALGLEAFPFGSCIVTNVGSFGLDEGFAPHVPFARVPILILLGAIRENPVVIDGKVEIRPQITITATIDHRFVDGAEASLLAKTARSVLENPWTLEGWEGPPADLKSE